MIRSIQPNLDIENSEKGNETPEVNKNILNDLINNLDNDSSIIIPKQIIEYLVDEIGQILQLNEDESCDIALRKKIPVLLKYMDMILDRIKSYGVLKPDLLILLILSDISHKIRGIYGNIQHWPQFIAGSNEEKDRRAFIQQMSQLVCQQLSQFSDMSMEILGREKFAVSSIRTIVKDMCATNTVEYVDNLPADLVVHCHNQIIRSIVYEMMENYSKYGKDGKVSVIIDNTQDHKKIIIKLTNGIIPKREGVFSSGSGLPIAQKYAHLADGQFTGEKNEAENTYTATFSLPVYQKENHS